MAWVSPSGRGQLFVCQVHAACLADAVVEELVGGGQKMRGLLADDVEVAGLDGVGDGQALYAGAVDRGCVRQDGDPEALGYQFQDKIGVFHFVGDVPPVSDRGKEAVHRVPLAAE